MRKEINWISVKDQSPEVGVNVDLRGENWRSSGWLTKSVFWSIAHSKNVSILSKPTHWAFINKPGQPKKPDAKQPLNLRLHPDVIDIIRSKPNQVAYIEALVREDKLKNG